MRKIIISDTSCIIILNKIGELDLLRKVYGSVTTTIEIAKEFGDILPKWFEIVSVKDKLTLQLLEMQIDKGEASAIALALETSNCTVILDDYKARKIADKLGLIFTGTLGVIIKAKLNGIIPSIIPILKRIKETNFRLSSEIELRALNEAGE